MKTRAAIIVAVVSALLSAISYFYLDIPLANYCRNLNRSITNVADVITQLGTSHWYLICGVILYVLFRFILQNKINSNRVLLVFGSLALSGIAVNVIKWFAGRHRPVQMFQEGLYGFGFWGSGYEYTSFPSGHAQTAFALASAIAVIFPRSGIIAYFLAAIIGATRIILTSHFLSDVIAGAGIGILGTMLVQHIFELTNIPLNDQENKG